MAQKILIVNADDYGRTPGVSKGIREAHQRGIVTSTTAMMNRPGIAEELRLAAEETPDLGIGVHLVLTSGAPLLPPERVRSITGDAAEFPNPRDLARRIAQIDRDEVAAEWDAQIQAFRRATGREPDHLDSHHHTSYFTEPLFRLFLDAARRCGCAVRVPFPTQSGRCDGLPGEFDGAAREFLPRLVRSGAVRRPDWFVGTFYDEDATYEHLVRILDQLGPGVSELMCHPGYADPALIAGSAYNRPREREIAILGDPTVRELLALRGIELISFSSLP
jgi:predicted glycoside hydrolase/deacetylase ChbG (UPF0249 family)